MSNETKMADNLVKVKEMVAKIAKFISKDKEMKETVLWIENSVATTKGHYANYVSLLKPWYEKDKMQMLGVAKGIKMIGADTYGVDWAVKMLAEKMM